MTALAELQSVISAAAERAGPSVVGVSGGRRRGSGVIVAPGRVLTTAHSLRPGSEPTLFLSDGRRVPAQARGVDPVLDLALLEAQTGDLDALAVSADGQQPPALGAPVVAVSRPGGRSLRVTLGFVSAHERKFRGPRGRRIAAVEHTARLPSGSSGSALLDAASGQLLGINAVRQEGGLILAIATGPLADAIAGLERGGGPSRRELGVALAPPPVARRLRRAVGLPERDGLLVREVRAQGAAARAGVQQGDLIVTVDGQEATSLDPLFGALDRVPASTEIMLGILRGTDERTVAVGLEEDPSTP